MFVRIFTLIHLKTHSRLKEAAMRMNHSIAAATLVIGFIACSNNNGAPQTAGTGGAAPGHGGASVPSGGSTTNGGSTGIDGSTGRGGAANASGGVGGQTSTTGGTTTSGGGSGSGGTATSQNQDAGIANCVLGLACPQTGLQCMSSLGQSCTCVGPPGGAFLTCNTMGSGGAGGASSAGGTSGTGGATNASGGSGAGGAATGGAGATGGVVGQACGGSAPWGTGNGDVQIVVDASQKGAAWSRFYEKGVACDHANTLLNTAYGRNAAAAIKKGHDQAGFQYVRFHGVLDSDIGVYSENNGTPTYTWTRFDQVYDAIINAGMHPIVEISFTPPPLASSTTGGAILGLWYNGVSPNISTPKDWTKWENLMTAIVQHLETRYTAADVRNNWFFEVWNEPSWMYQGGDGGYNELYGHTVKGLVAGDAQVKVGGPAGSGGESPGMISGLVSYAKNNNLKLDFVSFHSYSNDTGGYANPGAMLSFYNSISTTISSSKFTGTVINDEYGSSYDAVTSRDNEIAASFIAKTAHLIGTTSKAGPPFMYAWWTISDLYEEINTGSATAFRSGGNFGLLLKGDPAIPVSFDVAKPAFNAFRLLHMMGDTQIGTTGGTTADGVNAAATISSDGSAVQILVYNHVSGVNGNSFERKPSEAHCQQYSRIWKPQR